MVELLQSLASRLTTKLPSNLDSLGQLALNFWWSWTPEGVAIFRDIDVSAWEQCQHNPIQFLSTLSEEKLAQLATQPAYLERLRSAAAKFDSYMQSSHSTWAKQTAPEITPQQPVAYFSVEFGLHQTLHIYAGGLGILAGDHLKSASDLGLPMVGVGLLYRQGYFQQQLDASGWQQETYPEQDLETLPLELVRDSSGEPLKIKVTMCDRSVKVQAWRVRVGRVNLYLLDTGLEDNQKRDRQITNRLYQADDNVRIAQEMVLGIGGVRLLQHLGLDPKIYHLNESNAAFTLLEVARQLVHRGEPFERVKTVVQQRCVFTTHTPVLAGHQTFSIDLMTEYFANYWQQLGLTKDQFLALGASEQQDTEEKFSMTALALRLSKAANGVSQLNGGVNRQMWSPLYPQEIEPAPIEAITNGVHAGTWTAPSISELYAQYLDKDWTKRMSDRHLWENVNNIPDAEIWQRHQQLKEDLIAHVRTWVKQTRQRRGEDPQAIEECDRLFDPNVLTIGLARRFSSYKRGDLIFREPQRALQILSNSAQPVQIIFAGKAHPADDKSKQIIQNLIEWTRRPELHQRIIFLEDYDILIAKKLVQGVDLWLNTPLRPQEASGTSGQKVCFNGGINCSILDGWWREAYQQGADSKGVNGWAIGEDCSLDDSEAQAQKDAESLYDLLTREIVPLFYDRTSPELPDRWIAMMKASIKTAIPRFNTDRMVMEYVHQMYLSTANNAAPI